jgi:hypothetical protein
MSPRPAAEKEQVTRERLLLQHGLHLRAQALKAPPHIGHSCRDPYLRTSAQLDHCRSLSISACNRPRSAPRSTRIETPPGKSMWIAPVTRSRRASFTEAHDVVAAIHIDRLAGDRAGEIAGQETRRAANLELIHIAVAAETSPHAPSACRPAAPTPRAASVLIGPAEIAFTRIFCGPRLDAR